MKAIQFNFNSDSFTSENQRKRDAIQWLSLIRHVNWSMSYFI